MSTNIGEDGEGTHKGATDKFSNVLDNRKIYLKIEDARESKKVRRAVLDFFDPPMRKKNKIVRLMQKISKKIKSLIRK